MALSIGELVGFVRADDSGMRRGLSDAELRMRGFQRDTEGRLRHLDGRFATSGDLIAAGLATGTDEGDRFNLSLGKIAGKASGLLGVAGSVGKIAAMLGAAGPLAAGLVATLANIAPAGAVAVTAMLAVKQATLAVKLGTQGMGDALKVALDPEKAEEFEEALKKLSPEARKFAIAVRDLGPAWTSMQQEVQDELFRGLAENLQHTAKAVLPILRKELVSTATALGDMAAGAMGAARDLAEDGTLGKAMGSASQGLRNLSGLPGVVVTALGQIAAAAGPSFEGLTAAAAHSANAIGKRLAGAFESGAMQDAIQDAIDLIGDLVDVGMNVGSILGSVFSAAQVSGGGFIGTLQEITGALADAFASPAVQDGLKALFQTMATVAKTVAPLLGQALGVIAPVLAALGPPAQTLVKALGAGLSPIVEALGPVLLAAARAVGALVVAASPLLTIVGELAASLLPALTPLLDACTVVFEALAPVAEQVATILQQTLAPILAQLPGIIGPLADLIADRLVFFLGLLGDLLVELGPTFITLGEAAGELLVACAPLLEAFAELTSQLLVGLMPILQPLIGLVAGLAAILASGLVAVITQVVVPALQSLTALLTGDFSSAFHFANDAVNGAVRLIGQAHNKLVQIVEQAISSAIDWLRGMPGRASRALSSLAPNLRSRANEAGGALVAATRQKISEALAWIRGLPGRARSALGNIGGVLAAAGRSLISGFVSGIRSQFGSVQSTLGDLTSSLTSWKGPEDVDRKILTPAGRMVIAGFQRGIADQIPALRSQLQGLTGDVPGMALAGVGAPAAAGGGGVLTVRVVVDGPEAVKRLIRGIVATDGGGDVQATFGRGSKR
ncbi:hypothetical protein [Streptomyces sp. NPDC058614]|uniref:phage tail protein n=1 Tax=Streptomyces sp. NPDC058614 TaxID=3346557 RepID=UPI0036463334